MSRPKGSPTQRHVGRRASVDDARHAWGSRDIANDDNQPQFRSIRRQRHDFGELI